MFLACLRHGLDSVVLVREPNVDEGEPVRRDVALPSAGAERFQEPERLGLVSRGGISVGKDSERNGAAIR
jgi:hypothetical protein